MAILLINTDAALHDFCQKIQHCQWLTVDTEFLREKTYYPRLCLIQIASADHIACIDPLAIDDLSPLMSVLYQPDMTLVFHAARQDLELLYQQQGALPATVFDTQIAATLLGYGEQIGYGQLVQQCLGIQLDKAYARTDWSQRPLDKAQLSYAADDVRYLRDVYSYLLAQLHQYQRQHWLADEFAQLVNIKHYTAAPHEAWRKVKGMGKLKGQALAILQQLAAWREQHAMTTNRPKRWLLKDEVLLDLARIAPTQLTAMTKIRGIEKGTLNRHGQTLLTLIQQAKASPPTDWPKIKQTKALNARQDAVIDIMLTLVKHYCIQHHVSPNAVTSRKELEKFLLNDDSTRLSQGWRHELVGQHLTAFLDGQLTLSANRQQLTTSI